MSGQAPALAQHGYLGEGLDQPDELIALLRVLGGEGTGGFGHDIERPSLHGFVQQIRVVWVDSGDHQNGPGRFGHDSLGEVQTVLPLEVDIHGHEVGLVAVDQVHGLGAVRGLSHHEYLGVPLQDFTQGNLGGLRIVDDEYFYHGLPKYLFTVVSSPC